METVPPRKPLLATPVPASVPLFTATGPVPVADVPVAFPTRSVPPLTVVPPE